LASGTTLHTFSVELADSDRGKYASLDLRVARHPSETLPFMLVRLLAYCLEHEDGIAFTEGISTTDEPAVWVKDLTGQVRAWIEVGSPSAERLHKGSKQAPRCAVYTHRDAGMLIRQLSAGRVHRAQDIPVYAFDRGFVDAASAALPRRGKLAVSVSGQHLYLDVDGQTFDSAISEHRIA
jgi:uncharacterized protein YaeQ